MSDFTPQQAKAVHAADLSVALAAGAGCGKTFVLTERFLACLDPDRPGGPLRLDQLSAITFTERAAREMRERIRKTCRERVKTARDEHVDYWLRTLRDLDSARISTIHSFCGSLLRSHAVEASLDPHFQILDPAATQTVLFELVDDELRERLTTGEEEVIDLVAQFGLTKLRDMAIRLLNERHSIDWEFWDGQTPQQLVQRWEDFWRRDTLPRLAARVRDSREAATVLGLLSLEMPTHPVMLERAELLRALIPKLAGEGDLAAALKQIDAAARVQGGGLAAAWSSEATYAKFRDAAKLFRDFVDKLARHARFDATTALPAAKASLTLLRVARGLTAAYERRKSELAALDLDDLLISARNLLVGPARQELRRRLASQTRLLLVDEFQDTDPLQVDLVRALCDDSIGEGKLFFVGDYKQSIYRFRGADPQVFRRLRDEIPAAGRLPLTRNFRSQPAVLEFVNRLFGEEMGPEFEALEAHRQQLGPLPGAEFLWAMEPEKDNDCGDAAKRKSAEDAPEGDGAADELDESPVVRNRLREAEWIARRIRGMLDDGEQLVVDKKTNELRPVQPCDITLLFRALTNVEYYEEALRRHNIDYYLVGGHAFYAQQEIFDVVNLLRAISSPCDEVALTGILRSPMFGILDETLYRLSKHAQGLAGGFWSVLESAPPAPHVFRKNRQPTAARGARKMVAAGQKFMSFADPLRGEDSVANAGERAAPATGYAFNNIAPSEQSRVRFAANTLAELRGKKDRLPIAQLIHSAMERTGYDAMLLAEFLGERKLANLHKLIEQARKFDATGIFTLSDFILQISQFVARQPREPLAATQPESIDAVQLMTIHQSKGLEYPVVFVVDLDRHRRTVGEAAEFTRELGPMVRWPKGTSGYDLFQYAEQDEDLAESTRLLYVATTRAADYLVLSTGLEDLEKPQGPWMELVGRRFDLSTGKTVSEPKRALAKVISVMPPLTQNSVNGAAHHNLQNTLAAARDMAANGKGNAPPHLRAVPIDREAQGRFSVSRLHGTIRIRPSKPNGEQEEDAVVAASVLDPLGLGTLVHAVLAELVAGKDDSRAAIEALVRKHACIHLPDAGQELGEPIDLIAALTANPRWSGVRGAKRLRAELEFLLAWPPGSAEADGRYIQGFIDCLYEDSSGDWRLLDYKTNRVSADTLVETAAGYEMQMLVYALAVERVLKRPPVEIVLHFLRGGHEHRFTWNDAVRQRAIELVNAALQRATSESIHPETPR